MLNYIFSKRTTPPYFLSITFKPEMKFLSAFLFQVSDRKIYEWVKSGISSVVNREADFVERDLEWYGAKIQLETTSIYFTLEDNELESDAISTVDFEKILTVWFNEKQKYDKTIKRRQGTLL